MTHLYPAEQEVLDQLRTNPALELREYDEEPAVLFNTQTGETTALNPLIGKTIALTLYGCGFLTCVEHGNPAIFVPREMPAAQASFLEAL